MARVCIDCRYVNGRPSGIGEFVTALVEHMPRLAPDLDFVVLVAPGGQGELPSRPNVTEVVVKAAANGPGTMFWLPRLVDLRQIDLFHATFNILPAGLVMPCVTTIHDLMWLNLPEWCDTGLIRPVRQAFFAHGIRRALRRSDAIATVSEATKDAVVRRHPALADSTFVTRSGVADGFRPAPPDIPALAARGLDPSRRFVLTIGQFAPYKNHEMAVRAFALAAPGRGDADLVLVQRQGPHAARLLKLANSLGIGGRVRLLRTVSRNELVTLYGSASLLLHPSLCEGFGNPLAEAMACGCPVVTSNVSAAPEVTAGAAILTDPHDARNIANAIGRVLDDRRLALIMREAGLKRAAELTWESTAQANLAIYRRLLQPPG